MNAPTDPRELASAIVDGLLSADEATRAMAQPAVAAHVEELRQLRDLLREVPHPDELSKARALNAAIEAGMEAQRQSFEPTSPSPVPSLGGRRRAPAWLAVAAVLVLLALGAGLITSLRDGDDDLATSSADSETSTAEESVDSAAGGDGGSGNDEQGDGDAGSAPTQADEQEGAGRSGATGLGSVDTAHDLAALALDDYLTHGEGPEPPVASSDATTESGSESSERCAAQTPEGDSDYGTSVHFATAELDGEQVWVHLYDQSGGELLMVATNESCVAVAEELIEP